MDAHAFALPCADYSERVRQSFARKGAMRTLGATPADVKFGRTLAITRGEVHAETGGRRRLVALVRQTLIVMRGIPDGG